MSVETIRDIPVFVEHRRGCRGDFEPMDCYEVHPSGFPFDNSGRRTRDPLEDIAQRHPEFAQHLQGFPRRTQRSGGGQDEDEFLRRRFERPFSSGRFERFGFPFDRDDFEREPQRYYEAYPEYFESFQNQNPTQSPTQNQPQQQASSSQGYQQYPPHYSQQYQPQQSQDNQQSSQPQYQTQTSQSVSQGTQTEDECQVEEQPQQASTESQEQKESGQTRGRPIQQSNTCDLAQHQPPDEALNERGQRSMSAPPENKRFTSSVNIPMGGHQESGGTPPKSQTGSGSTERVIPIHVEGRDDPVMPKNFSGPAPSQPHHHQQQPQPERVFSEGPRAQPETIFGRRPEAFAQFVHREPHRFPNDWPPHSFGGFPEEEFGFRQTESPTRFGGARPQAQQQQPQRQEAASQQAQKPQPQTTLDKETETATPPPKQQQQQPLGPIEQIQAIQKDVSSLLRQVEAFGGIPKDKNYLYLDEMLTRNLLKLDNVDPQGQDSIRSARKEAIKCIERAIGLLEAKAAANVAPKQETMEVEQTQPPQASDKMDIEPEQSVMEMSPAPAACQNDFVEAAPASEEATKSEDVQQPLEQPNSAETVELKKEEVTSTPKKEEEPPKEDAKESGEPKVQLKEGEKKEKKKIKKKVIKDKKE